MCTPEFVGWAKAPEDPTATRSRMAPLPTDKARCSQVGKGAQRRARFDVAELVEQMLHHRAVLLGTDRRVTVLQPLKQRGQHMSHRQIGFEWTGLGGVHAENVTKDV